MSRNRINSLKNPTSRRSDYQDRQGIVLLVTLVLLVVLSAMGYTLSVRVTAQRHRDRYIIDYTKARYGCESAVKYAFARFQEITPRLVSRPNEPDFSDLFFLDEAEYKELLAEWGDESELAEIDRRESSYGIGDINDVNSLSDVNYFDDTAGIADFNEPNTITVRGPYGPPWPLIAEPIEMDIGSTKVTIEIEDENAKYPISWMLLSDNTIQRETEAGLETFCEWMCRDVNDVQIDVEALKLQLEEVRKIKPFKLAFKPKKQVQAVGPEGRKGRRTRRRSRRTPSRTVKTISASAQITQQAADFARIFHSSLIDTEPLAQPTIITKDRKESTLKYMGMWASRKVNINTAPRHVLEAAFTFGGDADKIADEIISLRRLKPFADIDELKAELFRYSESITKCEKYITTVSSFFTIKITAASGVAKASVVVAVVREDEKIKRIAVLPG